MSGHTRSGTATISNLASTSRTWSLAVTDSVGAGVTFSLSSGTVTLAAGASATITVTMTAAKGAAFGDHQAWLRVKDGDTTVAHAALYVFVK